MQQANQERIQSYITRHVCICMYLCAYISYISAAASILFIIYMQMSKAYEKEHL